MGKWQIGACALSLVVVVAGSTAPARAIDTKVYTGLGCRAAELPPAPQPTFNANGGIHLNGHNAPGTAIGAYALECILPLRTGVAPGILMYRVIEAD